MVKKTNVIEWVGAGPDDILWVYPYEDIRWGSMVVVHEYENAIFLRDGKIYDVLGPGRHIITTQNIPLLTRAYRLVMGYGETPFKATVVFVSQKQFRGKFGVNTRVKLSPQALYTTELQAFGEYWFRIEDPILFLTQVAGAVPSFSSGDVSNFIRSFFVELFMQEIGKFAATDIYTRLETISAKIKSDTVYDAFKQRGMELIDLKVSGVSLPLLEKMEKEDTTYGLPLLIAIQQGKEDKVLELVRTVESMRAIGKSPGAGILGALFAIPSMLGGGGGGFISSGTVTPPTPGGGAVGGSAAPSQVAPSLQEKKTPADKLRELKQLLDEGLITQEEYDQAKKEILEQLKKG